MDITTKDRFPPASQMTAPLKDEPARTSNEKLQGAFRARNFNQLKARGLFAEIISDLPSEEANWPMLAECKLEIGYTYPEGSVEREQFAIEAKQDLDLIYNNKASWDGLDIAQKTAKYKKMKSLLEEFQRLIPDAEASVKADIASKIKECTLHIHPLSFFYDKLEQGNQFLKAKQLDPARKLFEEALAMIEGHCELDYLLARALGTAHLASTYPPGDDFNRLAMEARRRAFDAYAEKEQLFMFSDEKTKAALSLFVKLFNGLSDFFPAERDVYPQIQERLAECKRQLASLAQAGEPTHPGPKVTPNPPNDSWKRVRIFAAFAIAAVVIVGAVVLGRRFFTRLS